MRPNKLSRGILILISVFLLAGIAAAQDRQTSRSNRHDIRKEPIVVNVWAAANSASEERLSRDFAATGLRATTLLRDWQRRIAFNIQMGLPLCERCIAVDGDHAADTLRLAALAALTDADGAALQQLLN